MNRRLFLSTPLRNEINNIERLFSSVAAQDYRVTLWVIVENGSTDGSREDLVSRRPPENVENLIVLNEDTESGEYALGAKYARLVNRGFDEILRQNTLMSDDMIGILDADSFPAPGYYRALAEAFDNDSSLGIASGISRDEGSERVSIHAGDWVRGSCRIWRGACMSQSGYIIGPSADTLSLARAELDGWSAKVVPQAEFFAREVGQRAKQRYYGSSAYFRGNTPLYALIRFGKFVLYGRFLDGAGYLSGYFGALRRKEERLQDDELRQYFRRYVARKLRKRFESS